jgi:hypothetical protein
MKTTTKTSAPVTDLLGVMSRRSDRSVTTSITDGAQKERAAAQVISFPAPTCSKRRSSDREGHQ